MFKRCLLRLVPSLSLFCITVSLLLCGTVALSEAFKLPDTGQTKCYETDSPYAEIPCAGTGQDGAYAINPMSFTDKGDGTVTDNNTGLIWRKEDDDTTRTWDAAVSYCASLGTDWRLPSKKELISIVDYSIEYPGPAINPVFTNTNATNYWSSTTFLSFPTVTWGVDFEQGYVEGAKDDKLYVRCVRGGQEAASLTDNGNGTVTDNKTGFVWQQGNPGSMTWGAALSYCEGLTLGGDSGWRLPNVKELESLTDDSRNNPAIDTNYFPNVSASEYWSATHHASFSSNVWRVNFGHGSVTSQNDESDSKNVRCVRGGQYCASTLSSSDLSIHVPILDFAGYHYWVDFMYVPDLDFTIVNAGEVSDLGPYNACTHATLSETTLGVHIPNLLFDGASYWFDFVYKEGLTFTLFNLGGN